MTNTTMGEILVARPNVPKLPTGVPAMTYAVQPSNTIVPTNVANNGGVVTTPSVAPLSGADEGYSIFGFQISRTMCYIMVGIIIVIILYYVWKWWSGGSNDKRNRPQNVSYQEQMRQHGNMSGQGEEDEELVSSGQNDPNDQNEQNEQNEQNDPNEQNYEDNDPEANGKQNPEQPDEQEAEQNNE